MDEHLTAASFSADQRRRYAKDGVAMSDGSFPIRNRSDLKNAIRALGRAGNMQAAREHIIRRARDLGLTGQLPQTWGMRAAADAIWQPFTATSSTGGIVFDYNPSEAAMVSSLTIEPLVGQNIGLAPLMPPDEWFEDPQLEGPTPLTVTADGRVFGHLAEFGKCHRGIQGRCIMAPRTKNGYADFYGGGKILTASGRQVPVGKLTVNAHHAPLTARPGAAAAHYDHSGAVAAFVAAGEDTFGPWLAGATKSDATPEQIRDLRANPPSGDWRNTQGRGLELVAALAVPVPGFPVMAVTASAGGLEQVDALIMAWGDEGPLAITASGGLLDDPLVASARVRALGAKITGGVAALGRLFE